MREVFAELPEACTNTLAVAERCNLELTFGAVPPARATRCRPATTLGLLPPASCAEDGLAPALPRAVTPEIRARLEYEMDVIQQMGFPATS